MTAGRNIQAVPARDAVQLLTLQSAELDELFARTEAGPMPDGEYRGTLILPLGPTPLRSAVTLAGRIAWQGKIFNAKARRVTNQVLPFAIRAVTAEVRWEPSQMDGRECIVLDYSRTSLIARGVRDELRLIRPGLYLGRAYWHGVRIVNFVLEA